MNRRESVKTAGITAAATATGTLSRAAEEALDGKKPNILLIVCDDLGWRDTAVYGSTFYATPNIDALAKSGMLFTDAYSANPLCPPTRASILTGNTHCTTDSLRPVATSSSFSSTRMSSNGLRRYAAMDLPPSTPNNQINQGRKTCQL
jgi:hypothetical protein